MKSPTIRQLAQTEKPLVLPGAHDALSALIIKQAGFKVADLKSGELRLVGTGTPFEEYTKIVGIERWGRIEREYGPT